MEYLYLLQQALIWIITIYWAYQIVVSFCSLIKLKDKKLLIEKEHKFMAVVPAHNEETVIKNLVESLVAQDYPKELYDIYEYNDDEYFILIEGEDKYIYYDPVMDSRYY